MSSTTPDPSTPVSAPASSQPFTDANSSTVYEHSEDFETVLLNPSSTPAIPSPAPMQPSSNTQATSPNPPAQPNSEEEPKHCWICLLDSNDPTPQSTEWRFPCPCNLQAHEDCLLEWIADLEATGAVTVNGAGQSQILCPQCKAHIKIAQPLDPLVLIVDRICGMGKRLILPAGLASLTGILYTGSMVYGVNALGLVFGEQDAVNMLHMDIVQRRAASHPLTNILPHDWAHAIFETLRMVKLDLVMKYTDPFVPVGSGRSWLATIGLPSIAPLLVISRTNLGDRLTSALPLLYLASSQHRQTINQWPPSPGLAFSILPYIRTFYRAGYNQMFAKLEKEWDAAVRRKPREGETAEDIARGEDARREEGQGMLGIEIDIVAVDEDGAEHVVRDVMPPAEVRRVVEEELGQPLEAIAEDETQARQPLQEGANVPLGALEQLAANQARARAGAPADAQQPDVPVAPAPAPVQQGDWEFRRNISTAEVATTVIGALFFPAISSLMGDLLKLTIPKSWAEIPRHRTWRVGVRGGLGPTGLLQEKWGRSLVGGCLFIVVKDALILYAKWRKAKNVGRRKVVDFKRPKVAERAA